MKYFSSLLLLLCIYSVSIAQPAVGTWHNTGPIQFPVNVSGQVDGMGRVSQIKFHHSNPAKVYAVSASGGLFISNDTGNTWTPTPGTEILPTTACSSVCLDYTSDSILYLSTGDQNYYDSWYGIYKSTNGGNTWSPANSGIGNRMAVDIIMDPVNHNTLVAATTDGIWKTTNGGATWTETLTSGAFKSIKMKPGSNNILYAATGDLFYKSTNMGSSWTNITSGVSVPSGNEGIRIAVTPADTNVVFLGTTGGYGQIMKSTDGGNSFTTIYTSGTQCVVCYDSTITSGSQGYYNFNLTVNPANANELLLVSHCIWRSTDGGYTWSWRTQWYDQVHTDMHDIEFDPYNLSMRFNANDGGVWLSRDTLATLWETRSTGLAATEMYHGAQSPVDREMISAGTQDNGELYYDGIWKCNRGGDWGARCAIDYLGQNAVYYDNGNRRTLTPLGGDQSYNGPFTAPPAFHIEFLKSLHNTAFIGTDSIWRSNDINTTTPTWTYLYTTGDPLMDIASCTADSNIFYAVTNAGTLLRTNNALAASPGFTTVSTPAATNVSASLATYKHNSNIVYLACGPTLYRSTDRGATWMNISAGLPSLNILKVISDEYSTTERLFICMGNYVYYKDNTTTTWTLSSGLPSIMNISNMMIYNDSTSASILRLSTYGRGAWECNIKNNLPPTGSFAANKQDLCPGDTIKYHKSVFGNITSFTWYFPGGVPATSTADSPIVSYSTTGVYNAKLVVIGASGNDTINYVSYINVSHGVYSTVTEGFEETSFPPTTQWVLESSSGINWQQNLVVGGYGSSAKSMFFDNFNNDGGGRHDRIVTPKLDLTYASAASIKFDVAYGYYPGYNDSLLVDISTDCGRTWSTIYAKDSNLLASAPDTTGYFVPNAGEWRTDSISLTPYLGGGVVLAFDNVGHYGQNIYIDNVNINITIPPHLSTNTVETAAKIEIYPNPTDDKITVKGDGFPGSHVSIDLFNIVGQLVASESAAVNSGSLSTSINLSTLPRGIYEVRIKDENGKSYVNKVVLR